MGAARTWRRAPRRAHWGCRTRLLSTENIAYVTLRKQLGRAWALSVTQRVETAAGSLLTHPHFVSGRDAYLDAVLDLYEENPRSIELMRNGGRILAYGVVMALWGAYREDDPASWPTIGRLKTAIGWFGMASPRQLDLVLARFTQVGHLHRAPAPGDRRRRLVLPTAALIAHDRAFLRAHFAPLGVLFGTGPYGRALAGEAALLRAVRAAWIDTLGAMARDIVRTNPQILRFYAASAGMLMLMKLVRLQQAADGCVEIDYTDFGRRFAVSRTHVRTLFRSAATAGDIEIDGRGRLRARPGLVAALDLNIAGRLALLDRSHRLALERLATPALSPGDGAKALIGERL